MYQFTVNRTHINMAYIAEIIYPVAITNRSYLLRTMQDIIANITKHATVLIGEDATSRPKTVPDKLETQDASPFIQTYPTAQ